MLKANSKQANSVNIIGYRFLDTECSREGTWFEYSIEDILNIDTMNNELESLEKSIDDINGFLQFGWDEIISGVLKYSEMAEEPKKEWHFINDFEMTGYDSCIHDEFMIIIDTEIVPDKNTIWNYNGERIYYNL